MYYWSIVFVHPFFNALKKIFHYNQQVFMSDTTDWTKSLKTG
ncbi:hypothetical protein SHD_3127 [Shewanella decolorationis S12]|uniref:Uncharacterized protein n=1 Tax=Shewanella decolorationis S12 TaxID=1353536 RepID=A0ABP2Z1W0_9GAMM|nr:hypothetical protein SHD_3127 [Shewanella decolorationis S12]